MRSKSVVADALDRDGLTAAIQEAEPDVMIHQLTALADASGNFRKFDEEFALTNRLCREATDTTRRARPSQFHDFREAMPGGPTVRSFLPPGVPAELTWTIFHSDSSLEAIRFAFDGRETAFWSWLGSDRTQVFTRRDWEQI